MYRIGSQETSWNIYISCLKDMFHYICMNRFKVSIYLFERVSSKGSACSSRDCKYETSGIWVSTSKNISQWQVFWSIKCQDISIEVGKPSTPKITQNCYFRGEVESSMTGNISDYISLLVCSREDNLRVLVTSGCWWIDKVSRDTQSSKWKTASIISVIGKISDDNKICYMVGNISRVDKISFHTDIESLKVWCDIVCLSDSSRVLSVSTDSEEKIICIRVYIFI